MIKLVISAALILFFAKSLFAFEIDFSRRKPFMNNHEMPAHEVPNPEMSAEALQTPKLPEPTSVEKIKTNFEPSQDVVILNTEKGFLPQSLSLKEGTKYRISVVNVNEKEKNVSFIMSAFAQYHGTSYGQITTFEVTPQKEGVYTYQCPETSLEGKVVVIPPQDNRSLASEK